MEVKCKRCGGTMRLDLFQSDASRQLYIDYFAGQHAHAGESMKPVEKRMTYHERNALRT